MRLFTAIPTASRKAVASVAAMVTLFAAGLLVVAIAQSAQAATTRVPLGTASKFAVLAGSGMTNTGVSRIVGDVGSSPTSAQTGFVDCPGGADCVILTGTNHDAPNPNDPVTQTAKDDLTNAYVNAENRAATEIPTELGNTTRKDGVYDSASGDFGITGTLTLDGEGNPGAVFIFQTTTTLTTAAGSRVELINGAQACNVFWQIGSSATLGTASTFRGNILALTSITATTGATIDGRLLARNGAVTLDTNTIRKQTCSTTPPSTTAPSTTAPSTTTSTQPTQTTTTSVPPSTPGPVPTAVDGGLSGPSVSGSTPADSDPNLLGVVGIVAGLAMASAGAISLRRSRKAARGSR